MESQDVILPVAYRKGCYPYSVNSGFVYFIYSGGRVKIGYSADIATRMFGIANGSPFRPTFLFAIAGTIRDEKELHARFAEERAHLEWFRLSERLRRYLVGKLDAGGLEAFRKAEDDFLGSFLPAPETKSKSVKPKKLCGHGKPMSKPCTKCTRETALKIYADLVERIGR